MSPFVSNAQRKFMFSKKPELAKEFAAETPRGKKLPEHVAKRGKRAKSKMTLKKGSA